MKSVVRVLFLAITIAAFFIVPFSPSVSAYDINDSTWAISTISTVAESGNTIDGVAASDSVFFAVSCGTTGLFLYKTTDGAVSWTRTTITTSSTLTCGVDNAIRGNQTRIQAPSSTFVQVLFTDRVGSSTDRFRIATSTDGGTSFSLTNLWNRIPSAFGISVESSSRGFICAMKESDSLRVWKNSGSGFSSTNITIATTGTNANPFSCDIASDKNVNVLLSVTYNPSADSTRVRGEIFKSDDTGSTFTSSLIHSSSSGTNNCGRAGRSPIIIESPTTYRIIVKHGSDPDGPTCTGGLVCQPVNGAEVTCVILIESTNSGATWTTKKFTGVGTIEITTSSVNNGLDFAVFGAVGLGNGGFLLLSNNGAVNPSVMLREQNIVSLATEKTNINADCPSISDGFGFDYITNHPLVFTAQLSGTDQARLCKGTTPDLAVLTAGAPVPVEIFCPLANIPNFGYNFAEDFFVDSRQTSDEGVTVQFRNGGRDDDLGYLGLALDGKSVKYTFPASLKTDVDGASSVFRISTSFVDVVPSTSSKGNLGMTSGAFFNSMQMEMKESGNDWKLSVFKIIKGTRTTVTGPFTITQNPNDWSDFKVVVDTRNGFINITESGTLHVSSVPATEFVRKGIHSIWYTNSATGSFIFAGTGMAAKGQRTDNPQSSCVLDDEGRNSALGPTTTPPSVKGTGPGPGEPGGPLQAPSFPGLGVSEIATSLGWTEQAASFFIAAFLILGMAGVGWIFSNGSLGFSGLTAGVGFIFALAFGLIPVWFVIISAIIAVGIIIVANRATSTN